METPPTASRKHSLTTSFLVSPPRSAQSSSGSQDHAGNETGEKDDEGGGKDGGVGAARARKTGLPTVYGRYGTVPDFDDDMFFDFDGTSCATA